MIRSFFDTHHDVITGVCLLAENQQPTTFADTARVYIGRVADHELETYLDTNDWSDKAGGYNLFDRQHASWPITTQGDPTTIVGLPMRRLTPMLKAMGCK